MMDILSNVEGACRLCLQGEGKISVFENDSKTRTVTPENIYDCVSVKITKDDKLPKGICQSCLLSVQSWCTFKTTCDETQKALQGWLLHDNLKEVNEKENAHLPTEKEDIKNSSCNTYKIEDKNASNDSVRVALPERFINSSCEPQLDIHTEGEKERDNVCTRAIELDDSCIPTENECDTTTASGLSVKNGFPNILNSFSTPEGGACESNTCKNIDLPKQPETVNNSENSTQDMYILATKTNVNIINDTRQNEDNISSELICKNVFNNDKGSVKSSCDSETNKDESAFSEDELTNKISIIESNCFSSSKNEETLAADYDETSCSGSISQKVRNQENLDLQKFESGSEQFSNENSLIDSTNNNFIDNTENSTSSDTFPRFKDGIGSPIPCEESIRNHSPSVANTGSTSKSPNNCLVDSDKENSIPNSCDSDNTLKKTDSNNEKQSVSDVEGNENSVDGEGLSFSDIRIESTSTLTEDINFNTSFIGNSFDPDTEDQNQTPEDSIEGCDSPAVSNINCKDSSLNSEISVDHKLNSESQNRSLVSSTQIIATKESPKQNEVIDATSVPSCSELSQVGGTLRPSEQNDILGSTEKNETLPHNDTLLSASEGAALVQDTSDSTSCKESALLSEAVRTSEPNAPIDATPTDTPSLVLNIKQEPVDPPPEVDHPSELQFQIRVKSEFSTFDFEEDYESIEGGNENGTSETKLNTNDSSTNECHICNRRYASLANYTKHLSTKVHLYNSGMSGKPDSLPEENISQDSPMLRSRLSGSMVSESLDASEDERAVSQISQFPSKRKITEHCDLCNTSFGYVSELRRHLLSKKHKDNERFAKQTQFSSAKKLCLSKSPPPSDNRSIFICPIENCHFSCVKGSSLLSHMKIHGIEQPEETKDDYTPPKPKLSARQQDLLRKDAEKKKLLAQQQQQQQQQLQLQHQQQALQFQQQQQKQQQKQLLQLQLQQSLEDENFSEDYSPPGHSRDYECEGCHKTFIRESGLRKHGHYCTALESADGGEQSKEKVNNIESKDNKKTEKLHCPLCDISFASRNVFVSHVQIYHKGSNLENGLLKPHKKPPVVQISKKLRVTNKKGLGFICNICGKKFNLLSSLNYHLKSHSVSVKHICRICKEGFNSRKSFMEHCRMHFLKPGSKETLCHKCFKVFKTRSELYYHRKNDLCSIKLKIYSCNLCQHSFKDPSALEEHKVVYHSESLDMSEDAGPSTSLGELYDDSFISLDPLSLIPSSNETLPGTSSKPSVSYNSKIVASYNKNAFNKNNSNFNSKVSSSDFTKSAAKSQFHCDICDTDYVSRQTLRKHIKKFHILNLPYMGSRKYTSYKKVNILQANALKQWKCRHCKTAFGSRKLLVLHLKKCQYNVLDLAKGMCYQCGKWCESGKTRICRFCLPDLTKSRTQQNNFVESSSFQKPDYQSYPGYKTVKREFSSPKEPLGEHFLDIQDYSSFQNHSSNLTNENFPVKVKTEISKNNSHSQKNQDGMGMKSIQLMKCPIGNKYFRNEMTMIKHYSQCDGNCENRCSHCRRMFHSPKEYRLHLINSKCFGPRRSQSRLKYPSFGSKKKYSRSSVAKQDISFRSMDIKPSYLTHKNYLDESEDKLPDDSSDVTQDMSTVGSTISEESFFGLESSASSSANKLLEEKSLKIGRVCKLCDKVITMQRAVYRHVYGCFKVFMLSQDSVSCRTCLKTFSKHCTMKENTAAIKQHILDCHYIPYYVGEGLAEDGTRLNTPPPLLCYVCSFGFTSNENLQQHIKDHRNKKDETNNVVLQLEDELLSDERLADEKNMFSLYVETKISNLYAVRTGRTLSLQDAPDTSVRSQVPGRKIFQCDKCSRNFTNRNKFSRHKKVHGIIKESVLHEVTENVLEFMNTNIPNNNPSDSSSQEISQTDISC